MRHIRLQKFSSMTKREREAIRAKFRDKPRNKHRVVFCRKTRILVIAAHYKTPLTATKLAIRGMINLYDPREVRVTSLPMENE